MLVRLAHLNWVNLLRKVYLREISKNRYDRRVKYIRVYYSKINENRVIFGGIKYNIMNYDKMKYGKV